MSAQQPVTPEEKRSRAAAYARAYARKHPEEVSAAGRAYRAAHREEINAKASAKRAPGVATRAAERAAKRAAAEVAAEAKRQAARLRRKPKPIVWQIAIVYAIHNTATGAAYVGCSSNFSHRMAEHLHALRRGKHANKHLQRAWNEAGESAFEFRALEGVALPADQHSDRASTGESGRKAEQRHINAYARTYNIWRATAQPIWDETGRTVVDGITFVLPPKKDAGYLKGPRVRSPEETAAMLDRMARARAAKAERRMATHATKYLDANTLQRIESG